MELANINMKKFAKVYYKKYDLVSNNKIDNFLRIAGKGDDFMLQHKDFVQTFSRFTKDFFCEYEQIVAFMLALEQMTDLNLQDNAVKLEQTDRIKEYLHYKELDFLKLDNYMCLCGYYSVYQDCVEDPAIAISAKEDGCLRYIPRGDDNQSEIKILFDVTADNGKEEPPYCFYLRVKDVYEV